MDVPELVLLQSELCDSLSHALSPGPFPRVLDGPAAVEDVPDVTRNCCTVLIHGKVVGIISEWVLDLDRHVLQTDEDVGEESTDGTVSQDSCSTRKTGRASKYIRTDVRRCDTYAK